MQNPVKERIVKLRDEIVQISEANKPCSLSLVWYDISVTSGQKSRFCRRFIGGFARTTLYCGQTMQSGRCMRNMQMPLPVRLFAKS